MQATANKNVRKSREQIPAKRKSAKSEEKSKIVALSEGKAARPSYVEQGGNGNVEDQPYMGMDQTRPTNSANDSTSSPPSSPLSQSNKKMY